MNLLLKGRDDDSQVAFGGEGACTLRDLMGLVERIAHALPLAARGQCVVLVCTDRYRFAAGLLAAWSRGFRVALPPNGQPDTVHALVARLGAVALLHDRATTQGLDIRSFEAGHGPAEAQPALALERDDCAIVAFTSGSTGEPEAHEKSLAQLLDETAALIACFDLAHARVLSAVPAQHIYGLLFGVLVPLLSGGALCRESPLLPADLFATAERQRADVLVLVPPHLRAMSRLASSSNARFRHVFSSGAPLSNEVAATLAAAGMPVTQVFGSTETGGIAYRQAPYAPFQPLPHVTLSKNDAGALCVDSPWLSAKVKRPMETQDRIELLSEGFVHVGRLDSVVKVGGRRVDLGDVESRIRRIAGVRDVRVLAESGDAARGTSLLCVVEADDLRVESVRDELSKSLDPVVVPKRMRVVSSLPRNATGKVIRDSLIALFDTRTCPQHTSESGDVVFEVPAQLAFFRGHFDGHPILPGVVQLHYLALAEARKRWPELRALVRTSRVKFKRPVTPGEVLTLSLSRKRTNLVEFSLTVGPESASSGLFHFEDVVQPGAAHE